MKYQSSYSIILILVSLLPLAVMGYVLSFHILENTINAYQQYGDDIPLMASIIASYEQTIYDQSNSHAKLLFALYVVSLPFLVYYAIKSHQKNKLNPPLDKSSTIIQNWLSVVILISTPIIMLYSFLGLSILKVYSINKPFDVDTIIGHNIGMDLSFEIHKLQETLNFYSNLPYYFLGYAIFIIVMGYYSQKNILKNNDIVN